MKREEISKLLGKYYKGETSLEEEAQLKAAVENDPDHFEDEQLAFGFYRQEQEAVVPEDLEARLFEDIEDQKLKTRLLRSRWLKYSSVAAAVMVVSVFWFSYRTSNSSKMTNDERFAIMEQALMQVSNGLQPQGKQDLLVLYQDDQLEIVVN